MLVNPKDLTYISEKNLLKIILSSADQFPGLYRVSSAWEQSLADKKFMKFINFMEAIYETSKGKQWNKGQWLKAHYDIFESAFGLNSRNDQREETDLKALLKERNLAWFDNTLQFRLAVIDTITTTYEICENRSYYVMGSIIRFDSDKVRISYDYYSDESYLDLIIPFPEVKNYIEETFSPETINTLFLNAEVVGHLVFKDNIGQLFSKDESIEKLFTYLMPSSHIFASVIYKRKLPIEYAKPIGVSNVATLFG